MTISYLNSTQTEVYKPESFSYLNLNIRNITDAANKIGISAGAIAGAMVEENDNYDWGDQLRDQYAVLAIMSRYGDEEKNEFLVALEQGVEQA
jgi:O-acetyl-ADP-ribose deacetylase (regulator of RNase III)